MPYTLTPLPNPPSTSDPENFSTEADAFIAAFPVLVSQINAMLVALNLAPVGPSGLAAHNPPYFVDMHYGALRGTPWNASESGGTVAYTVAAPAAIGATALTLSGGVYPVNGQLIVLKSVASNVTGFEYRSARVKSGGGTASIVLSAPLEAAVAAGANAWNFYLNPSHPNQHGFEVIADYALREPLHAWVREQVARFGSQGRGALSLNQGPSPSANDAAKPGAETNPSWHFSFTSGAADTYAIATFRPERTGYYRLRFPLNTQGVNATLNIKFINPDTGTDFQFYNEVINQSEPSVIERDIYVQPGATNDITIALIVPNGVAGTFDFLDVEVMRFDNAILTEDRLAASTILLLGDSWFANTPGIYDRFVARLPGATIINAGHGGDTADALLARFTSAVESQSPAVVFIMAGTNDAGNSIQTTTFMDKMLKLLFRSQRKGYIPVFFTPSVGDLSADPDAFELSRDYAARMPYTAQINVPQPVKERVSFSMDIANGTTRVLASLGSYDGSITFYKVNSSHALLVRDGTTLPGSTTIATLSATPTEADATYSTTGAAVREVDLAYTNTSGTTQTVSGYVVVEKPITT